MADGNGKKDPYVPDAEKFHVGDALTIEAQAKAPYGERFNEEKGCYVPINEHGEEAEQLVELKGEHVEVVSAPYVAQDGPNKGEVVYPVKLADEAGGAMVGVPEGRLARRRDRRVMVSLTPEQYERIFGNKPEGSDDGS